MNYAFAYLESGDIYLTTIDGAVTKRLTNTKGQAFNWGFAWSPDLDAETPGYQGKIAYYHYPDGGTGHFDATDVYVMNPDGSGKQLVRSFAPGEKPRPNATLVGTIPLAWTPNGQEIVFASDGVFSPATAICSLELATGNVRTHLSSSESLVPLGMPSLSPLGFMAFRRSWDINLAEFYLDENGLMQLDELAPLINLTQSPHQDLLYHDPIWSPDGSRLAFIRDERFADLELIVYDLLFDESSSVLTDTDLPFDDLWRQRVTWSPDGSEMAFSLTAHVNNQSVTDIYRLVDWSDPDDRFWLPVTATDREREGTPAWNPGWVQP